MDANVRPATMERITTPELANAFIEEQIAQVRAQVGSKKVLLALSGGVDSSVVAALLIKAIGKQLVCVHVNHGLMRKGESEDVIRVFGEQMDYYNGKEREKRVLRWFVSIDKAADANVPDMSETQAYKNYKNGYPSGSMPSNDGFMNIPEGVDEELPFN